MATLILSSSFTFYKQDEDGNKIPTIIDNNNGFRDNLQKLLTKRDFCLIISGNPKKKRTHNPLDINIAGFEMSGIGFKEYIYLDDSNKHLAREYISKADCIDLCGGHLPTCNDFVEELNLRELLKDYKGVIIGASGGGMNLADKVYCIPEATGEAIDKNFKRVLRGCALTNINIIPHFQFSKSMQIDGMSMLNDILLPDSKEISMIAIPDGSYIIQDDNSIKLYGEAYLLKKGKMEIINQNNKITELKGENYE